jgi:hypothetical protein
MNNQIKKLKRFKEETIHFVLITRIPAVETKFDGIIEYEAKASKTSNGYIQCYCRDLVRYSKTELAELIEELESNNIIYTIL